MPAYFCNIVSKIGMRESIGGSHVVLVPGKQSFPYSPYRLSQPLAAAQEKSFCPNLSQVLTLSTVSLTYALPASDSV